MFSLSPSFECLGFGICLHGQIHSADSAAPQQKPLTLVQDISRPVSFYCLKVFIIKSIWTFCASMNTKLLGLPFLNSTSDSYRRLRFAHTWTVCTDT